MFGFVSPYRRTISVRSCIPRSGENFGIAEVLLRRDCGVGVEMALVLDVVMAVLKKQTIEEMVSELAFLAALLWIALLVGLLVGWAWRPRWVGNFVGEKGSSGGVLKTASDSLVAGESSGNEENGVDLMK